MTVVFVIFTCSFMTNIRLSMTPAIDVYVRHISECWEPLVVPRTLVATPHIMSNSILLKQTWTQAIVLVSILVGAPTVISKVCL